MSDTRNTNRVVTDIGEELGLQPTPPIKNTYEVVKEIRDLLEEGGGSSEDIAYIKTKVDTILGDLEDQSNGLGAIKTDTGSIKSTIEDQSNGLGAIKTDTASIKSAIEDSTTGIINTNTVVKQIADYVVDPNAGMAIASEVTEGKQEIAGAIVSKGGTATSGDSFHLLSTEIAAIPVGIDDTGVGYIAGSSRLGFLDWMMVQSVHESLTDNIETINDNTITNITRSEAFSKCPTLKSVTMSAVTEISASDIFSSTIAVPGKLSSISFPALQTINSSGGYAFSNCRALTSVNMPELTTVYGSSVFNNCVSLTEISLPKLTTIYGNQVFTHCDSLTEISLPELTAIYGNQTFTRCNSLTEISLPELTTLGSGGDTPGYGLATFNECTSLQRVSLPKLSYIGKGQSTYDGNSTFWECSNLEYIELGRLTSFPFATSNGMFSSLDKMSKLRTIKLNLGPNGEKTGVSLNFYQWKAADVIAKGPSGINELNQNLYNDLLTKLEDRTGLTACTLAIGWLSNVSQANINYASSLNWTLTS